MTSPPRLSLRPGEPGDLPFLRSLAPRLVASAPPWRRQDDLLAEYDVLFATALTDPEPDSAVLIACMGGQPVGFTLLYWHPQERGVFVKDLAVRADAEGQGVGRFLLEAVEHWGRHQGAREIMLKTSWFNDRARAFYADLGFREDHVALVLSLDG